MSISALCKFSKLEFDFSNLRGNYTPSKAKRRDLPDDEVITRCRQDIENPAWRWVYGIMDTYGLRNHEVFIKCQAFGSVGVFTAMVSVFKAWLESKKIQMIDLACQKVDGEAVKVRMQSATIEEVQTVLRELAPCYSIQQLA